jgi:broad specificity phosphatase PhoE
MSAAAVTEIYVVRHGETDWNQAQRLQGTIDTPLNRIGVAQAYQLADRFRALAVSAVVTSPLTRARMTAGAIARACHSAFVVDPLLAEVDHGSWAGLTVPAIARTSPGAVIDRQLQPEALGVSGGERLAAAYHRASTVLRQLVAAAPTTPVVVVSHGVINALLMCAAAGNVPSHMDKYTQPNGCTYRLRFRRRALVSVDCCSLVSPMSDVDARCFTPCRVTF